MSSTTDETSGLFGRRQGSLCEYAGGGVGGGEQCAGVGTVGVDCAGYECLLFPSILVCGDRAGRSPHGMVGSFYAGVRWIIVGLIARYGSPRVRGHGMPEAVEVIVFNGGKVQPRVAILKPIATAISIGSGGPFGAEGPVIMTGGAVGSVLGQLLPVTDAERTVLMVAGAAAGMAAAFSCPMSATLLAVELLLFEWRPRSLVPVAIACVTAGAVRRLLLGPGPIFPMQPTTVPMHHAAMLGALVIGMIAALLATGLSNALHFFEREFGKLPIHWMWWPALGGIVVGLGGLVFPPSLGVGYDVIRQLVNDQLTWKLIVGVLVVKTIIWRCRTGVGDGGRNSCSVVDDRRGDGSRDWTLDDSDFAWGVGCCGDDIADCGFDWARL